MNREPAVAIENYMPYPAARDWVTYDEAVDTFADTGHAVTKDQLRKWVKEEGLTTRGRGRRTQVAFSDLLVIHGERTADD